MTLVQTLLTPSGVIQVSDRQLTDGNGHVHSSTANKAVLWCGHMVVGFAGMAFTDSSLQRPISEWIALALRGAVTVGDAFEALQQAGSQLVFETDLKRRGLSMIFAGSPPGERKILMFAISNSMATGAAPENVDGRFWRSNDLVVPLHGSQYRYNTIGVPFPSEVKRRHETDLAAIHARYGINNAAKRMIAIQRRVNELQFQRHLGATVGRSAMVVSLPAAPDPDPAVTLIVTNPLNNTIQDILPMYSFVADHGFSKIRFGPHFVCGSAIGLDPQSGLKSSSHGQKQQQWSDIRVV